MADKANDTFVNTIIGPDTFVEGNINSAGFTRIDGSVKGDLSAAGRVIVGEKARMKSNIQGTFVTIGGVVFGNVIASEKIVVLSTGLVVGDIISRHIKADEGALLHGRVIICTSLEQWQSTINSYHDEMTIRKAVVTQEIKNVDEVNIVNELNEVSEAVTDDDLSSNDTPSSEIQNDFLFNDNSKAKQKRDGHGRHR
jgi:cytoskeletal protein CcmA (bactofilin family)